MAAAIIVIVLLVILALVVLFTGMVIVRQQEAVIIERLGKFNRVLHPGLRFKIPIIERVAHRASLRVQQLDVNIESKTQDNVFVSIPAAVQYRVPKDQVQLSYYELEDPVTQIRAYVSDTIRSSLSQMDLDVAFVSKDQIASEVEATLSTRMDGYGYLIVNTLVTDISPDDTVKESMNSINAAQRTREAQRALAEADKITEITRAEGKAEAQRLRGKGMADERHEIVTGMAEQLKVLEAAGIPTSETTTLLLMSQYFDTMSNVAGASETNTLMLPSNPQGVSNFAEELRNATIVGAKAAQPSSTVERSAADQEETEDE